MIFKDISHFANTNDYLPIFNAVLITDLIVILLLHAKYIRSSVLKQWYDSYNVSAVMADIFILFIGIILTRAFYPVLFKSFSIIHFVLLAIAIQITHDLLFYQFFTLFPRGMNGMIDTFKDYAKEMGFYAVMADSGMIAFSVLLASYLAGQTLNTNIIVAVFAVYTVPYFIYK